MRNRSKALSALSLAAIIFTGCQKSGMNQNNNVNLVPHHVYNLQAPDPARYEAIPAYNSSQINRMFGTIQSAPIPANYLLATPAVRNQEQIGSCTGFAGSEANEILDYYAGGNTWGQILSPLYLYYIERVKIQGQSITTDNGAAMVDIPLALKGYGQSTEALYLYPDNSTHTANSTSTAYTTPPTAAAVTNAALYKIGQSNSSYGRINQGDTATVKALLRQNIPVVVGFNVYDNSGYTIFEGLNTTNYTYSPLASNGSLKSGLSLLGGHANVIYGYDDAKGVFLLENSWTASWGNNGYWYMPYSVFKSSKIVPSGNVYWMKLN